MHLKIRKAKLIPDQHAFHIKITQVGLYDDAGNLVKWVKLNEETLQLLLNQDLQLT